MLKPSDHHLKNYEVLHNLSRLQILVINTNEGSMYRLYIGPYDNASAIDQYVYMTKEQLENLSAFLTNYLLNIENSYNKTS
jgi:hypothetical protein